MKKDTIQVHPDRVRTWHEVNEKYRELLYEALSPFMEQFMSIEDITERAHRDHERLQKLVRGGQKEVQLLERQLGIIRGMVKFIIIFLLIITIFILVIFIKT
jgi:hypothetical protein